MIVSLAKGKEVDEKQILSLVFIQFFNFNTLERFDPVVKHQKCNCKASQQYLKASKAKKQIKFNLL